LEQLKALNHILQGQRGQGREDGVRKLAYRVEKRNEGFYIPDPVLDRHYDVW